MEYYSDSFVKLIASSELSKLVQDDVIDNVDEIIDRVFQDNKLLDHVPFLKVLKAGYEDIRAAQHRIYLRKIFKFWFQVEKASEAAKAKYKEKLAADPEEVRKTGEAIWEILDSISNSEKAPMVGKVFEAYMAGEITGDQVIYLAEMIDKAYLYDLLSIERGAVLNRANLINIGFFEPVNYQKAIDDDLTSTMRGMSSSSPQQMQRTDHTTEGRLLELILRNY